MNSDFPAAHSMDTCWFAVDRDGHLAVFDSGEEGAVPNEAVYDSGLDVPELIALQAPQVFLATRNDENRHVQWPGFTAPECFTPRKPRWHWRFLLAKWKRSVEEWLDATSVGPLVCLLRSTDVLRKMHKDTLHSKPVDSYRVGARIERPDGCLWSVLFGSMNRRDYRLIHESGACFACAHLDEKGVADTGLYRFDNKEYGLEPYKRTAKPKTPLLLDELPEELRHAAGSIRFDGLCFAEVDCVQPLEHLPCRVYDPPPGCTYLASDMTTRRPLPPQSPV